MTLENDQAIRAQLICKGDDAQEIDNIHKYIGISYTQIQELEEDIGSFYGFN